MNPMHTTVNPGVIFIFLDITCHAFIKGGELEQFPYKRVSFCSTYDTIKTLKTI